MFNILATKYKPLTNLNNSSDLFVFTTLLQRGSQAHMLEEHCHRLTRHALIKGFQAPNLDNLLQDIKDSLQKNTTPSFSKTRVQLWEKDLKTHLTLLQVPVDFPIKHKELSVEAISTNMETSQEERIKSNNYAPFFKLVKSEGHKLFTDPQKNITSGLFDNFFLVHQTEKIVVTPSISSMVLRGITRHWAQKKLHSLGWKVIEKKIQITEITHENAAFLSSSIQGILPITNIGDTPLKQSEIVQQLSNEFNYKILQELGHSGE